MIDEAFLTVLCKENKDALLFVSLFSRIADIWDNLVDEPERVTEKDMSEAFWHALIGIPTNRFYLANVDTLAPVMAVGILDWRLANRYEKWGEVEGLVRAHTLRYMAANVFLTVAMLCGGPEHAEQLSLQIWERSHKDTLEHYLAEKGYSCHFLKTSQTSSEG